MRMCWCAAAVIVMAGLTSSAQRQDGAVKVYQVGHEVTAPQLLPVEFPNPADPGCSGAFNAAVELSMVVDATGVPRNVMFVRPSGTELDRVAVRIALLDRFRPATKDGAAVPVGESVAMKLDACLVVSEDANDHKSAHLKLQHPPEQKVAPFNGPGTQVYFPTETADQTQPTSDKSLYRITHGITPPVPILTPVAQYPHGVEKKMGVCLVSVVVDENGLPQRARVLHTFDPAFSQSALESVNRYRFKPAFKDGVQPVTVMITVEVNFRR